MAQAAAGWKGEKALGAHGQGISAPVEAAKQLGRVGLGFEARGLEMEVVTDQEIEEVEVHQTVEWLPECKEPLPTAGELDTWMLEGEVLGARCVSVRPAKVLMGAVVWSSIPWILVRRHAMWRHLSWPIYSMPSPFWMPLISTRKRGWPSSSEPPGRVVGNTCASRLGSGYGVSVRPHRSNALTFWSVSL